MQQILDKLGSGQPSHIAPPQDLEDSSIKGEKGTVSIIDKGKRVIANRMVSSSGGAILSIF